MVLWGAMVGIGSERANVALSDRLSSRNKMKARLQAKPTTTLQPLTTTQRKHIGIMDLNRGITDLKVEGGVTHQTKSQITDIQQRLQSPATNQQVQKRRDSNSTVSSYYGSMRSADMSRKSSLASQVSSNKYYITLGRFHLIYALCTRRQV